jgi:outer membrane immunogenic protein
MSLTSIWKNALAAVVAVAVIVPAAQAADLGGRGKSYKDDADYGPPRYLWTGLYTGVQAGYAWGQSRHTDSGGVTTGDFDTDGFIGGGTPGYNFQSGRIVWGLETDISYTDVSGSTFTACGAGCSSSMDWLWTLRGRVGVDINGWMPYITGGLAMADVSAVTQATSIGSETLTGWTVGGGLEVKLDRNWSFKTEYLYVDLGDMKGPLPGDIIRADFNDLHVVRAGINYKF